MTRENLILANIYKIQNLITIEDTRYSNCWVFLYECAHTKKKHDKGNKKTKGVNKKTVDKQRKDIVYGYMGRGICLGYLPHLEKSSFP